MSVAEKPRPIGGSTTDHNLHKQKARRARLSVRSILRPTYRQRKRAKHLSLYPRPSASQKHDVICARASLVDLANKLSRTPKVNQRAAWEADLIEKLSIFLLIVGTLALLGAETFGITLWHIFMYVIPQIKTGEKNKLTHLPD